MSIVAEWGESGTLLACPTSFIASRAGLAGCPGAPATTDGGGGAGAAKGAASALAAAFIGPAPPQAAVERRRARKAQASFIALGQTTRRIGSTLHLLATPLGAC